MFVDVVTVPSIPPPTYNLPLIPTPPVTTRSPVVVSVAVVPPTRFNVAALMPA